MLGRSDTEKKNVHNESLHFEFMEPYFKKSAVSPALKSLICKLYLIINIDMVIFVVSLYQISLPVPVLYYVSR